MANFPTQLDEIDQWLADNFGIIPGACSSTENLRHTTARMIAEALWPRQEEPQGLEEAAGEWCKKNHKGIALSGDKKSHYLADGLDAFIAGAKWGAEH